MITANTPTPGHEPVQPWRDEDSSINKSRAVTREGFPVCLGKKFIVDAFITSDEAIDDSIDLTIIDGTCVELDGLYVGEHGHEASAYKDMTAYEALELARHLTEAAMLLLQKKAPKAPSAGGAAINAALEKAREKNLPF